jgi:2-phospho-L-lactate guanylyltransferase
MRTAAVLPIKSFARAKARLGDAVRAPDRAELAAAMAADVLAALVAVEGLDDVVVVTAEPRAASAAEAVGAVVVHDPEEAGQSAAARRGVATAAARGAERVLLVPGDCPALAPDEVDELLATEPPGVTIVPDRHGTGTNALLLAPPGALDPAFGPNSFARHVERAGAAGRVAELPSLALDVDTPADLATLRDRADGAPRTRALLARPAFAACA